MSVSARLHPALLHLTAVALGCMKFVTCKTAERWIEGTVGESLYNGKKVCGRNAIRDEARGSEQGAFTRNGNFYSKK